MSNDIIHTKLRKRFNLLDADRDGYIDRNDFDTVAQRINENSSDGDPRRSAAVSAAFQKRWEWLVSLLDTDLDQRISEDEYIQGIRTRMDGDAHARNVRGIFELMDVDGDGKVTPEEFRTYLQACGVAQADADKSFAKLDVNQDGFLSLDEVAEASRQYFLSSDPNAPGNWLFGPLK